MTPPDGTAARDVELVAVLTLIGAHVRLADATGRTAAAAALRPLAAAIRNGRHRHPATAGRILELAELAALESRPGPHGALTGTDHA